MKVRKNEKLGASSIVVMYNEKKSCFKVLSQLYRHLKFKLIKLIQNEKSFKKLAKAGNSYQIY